MKHRLAIVTEIISPYRIPLFNDLAQHPAVDLHVIFLADTDPGLRQWRVYKEEIRFSYEVLSSRRMRLGSTQLLLNRGMAGALQAFRADAILCGGYNYAASWQALAWARRRKVPFLLWSESHSHELRRTRRLVEFLKNEFLHRCSGFVVPGRLAREYLHLRGIEDGIIFCAPNAVDNQLFGRAAAAARANSTVLRKELNLPDRYLLFVGRLVREKGIFELLQAYAQLDASVREQVGLVFAGDGEQRARLAQQSEGIAGAVHFAGFVHREQLAAYYALAEALILPTYTDTWGLVVNEGMACGLPLVVSDSAGCAPDMVREGWNGLLVPPRDIARLASALNTLATRSDLRTTMSQNSSQLIAEFSPRQWSAGVARAIGVES